MRKIAALAMVLATSWSKPVIAHESPLGMPYPSDCCSEDGLECDPVPWTAIKVVEGGYLVKLNPGDHKHVVTPVSRFIRFGDPDIRYSTDGLTHACVGVPGLAYGARISGAIHCIIIVPKAAGLRTSRI